LQYQSNISRAARQAESAPAVPVFLFAGPSIGFAGSDTYFGLIGKIACKPKSGPLLFFDQAGWQAAE